MSDPYIPSTIAPRFIPDLISTAEVLGPLLGRTNTFVLIQNGIGIESGLREAVGTEAMIISGCAWINTTTCDDGAVLKHGGSVSKNYQLMVPCSLTALSGSTFYWHSSWRKRRTYFLKCPEKTPRSW